MAYVVDYSGDKAFQLGVEQVIRALPFGPNWTKLRLAVLVSANATAGLATVVYQNLHIGVCTGAKAVYDNDCIDALSTGYFSNSASSVETYTANSYLIGNSGNTVGPVQKVGGAVSLLGSSNLVFASQRLSTLPTVARTLFMFDILKNAAVNTLNCSGFYMGTSTDITRPLYTLAIENETSPANVSTAATSNSTLPFRTARDWNAAFISWGYSVPTINIHAWSVVRFL